MLDRSDVERAASSLSATSNRLVSANILKTSLPEEPGMYAWWVDREGAEAFSNGLGETVREGLVYAGQAGATSWPSGRRAKSTIASRVWRNHLNGARRSSTFRATCGAILDSANRAPHPRTGQVSDFNEQALTHWLHRHMSLSVFEFENRDGLRDLERQVLGRLNPPLNLEGMSVTPVRIALRDLRKAKVLAEPVTARASSRSPAGKRTTLHLEIYHILSESAAASLTIHEIADRINERGRYKKRDGTGIEANQIHARTRKYSELFQRSGVNVVLK